MHMANKRLFRRLH